MVERLVRVALVIVLDKGKAALHLCRRGWADGRTSGADVVGDRAQQDEVLGDETATPSKMEGRDNAPTDATEPNFRKWSLTSPSLTVLQAGE